MNILNKQLDDKMVSKARSGEVVARDGLHRFIYVCSTCKTPGPVPFAEHLSHNQFGILFPLICDLFHQY